LSIYLGIIFLDTLLLVSYTQIIIVNSLQTISIELYKGGRLYCVVIKKGFY